MKRIELFPLRAEATVVDDMANIAGIHVIRMS